MKKVPFPRDTLIGAWRDKTLRWNNQSKDKGKAGIPRDPGEDFFFVQEVWTLFYSTFSSFFLCAEILCHIIMNVHFTHKNYP